MKIALLQLDIVWEDILANKLKIENALEQNNSFDILVLPEMFTTGFTMFPAPLAEKMDGVTMAWLKKLSVKYNCAITGSLIIKENNSYYNRMVFVHPNGKVDYYDKRHLFSLAGEVKVYTNGTNKKVVLYKEVRFCLQVCYDLRFPVFSRNTNDYDVLLYVANWPVQRINAWDALLKARAIENMSYAIGVNRVGEDANKHTYSGHSQAIDYLGKTIVEPYKEEAIAVFEIDLEALKLTRKKLDFLNDADVFKIIQ